MAQHYGAYVNFSRLKLTSTTKCHFEPHVSLKSYVGVGLGPSLFNESGSYTNAQGAGGRILGDIINSISVGLS